MAKKNQKPRGIPFNQIFLDEHFLRHYEILIREDPPDDPKLLSAIRCGLARCINIGAKHISSQTKKSKKPKGLIGEHPETAQSMREIVKGIVTKPENRDLTPDELWPLLFAALDDLGTEPKELKNTKSYRYTPLSGGKKTISFGRFRNLISEIRNE